MLKTLYLRAKLAVLLGAAFLNPPLFANNQRSNPSTAPTKSKLPPCQLVFDKCVGPGTYKLTYPLNYGVQTVKYVFYGEWKKDRPHGFGWLDTFNGIKGERPDKRTVGFFKNGQPHDAIEYDYFSPLHVGEGEVEDIYVKGWTRRSYENAFRQPFKYDRNLFVESNIVNFPYVNPADKELVNELDVVVVSVNTSEDWKSNLTICVKNLINADVLKVHSIVKSELVSPVSIQ